MHLLVSQCKHPPNPTKTRSEQLKPLQKKQASNLSQRTSTKILSNSTNTIDFPKHPHRPLPNTNSIVLSISFRRPSSASNHRSGRKSSTSSPYTSFRSMTHTQCPIAVPPGTNRPLITSPPGFTILASRPVMGGWMRRPSLMTACRYGILRASAEVTGEEIAALWEAAFISATRRL